MPNALRTIRGLTPKPKAQLLKPPARVAQQKVPEEFSIILERFGE